jgi:uncharacterized membrane protein (DUF2068 family)
LPLEIRELSRGVTLLRSVLFLGNLAIVSYMIYLLRAAHRRRRNVAVQAETGDSSPD